VRVWRIARVVHAAFDGEGVRIYGSRWTPRGIAAVFTSATLSLAALERFVHTDPDLEPDDLVAISVDIDSKLPIQVVATGDLPSNWRAQPPPSELSRVGDRWLQGGRTAVLSVPSVVIPHERNFIINPNHADFRTIEVGQSEPFSFDPRMWKRRP
jgi:RES domain-containing protein